MTEKFKGEMPPQENREKNEGRESREITEQVILQQLTNGERWPQKVGKPSKGYWDDRLDLRTNYPTIPSSRVLSNKENKYFVRTVAEATSSCPSGPCGCETRIRTGVAQPPSLVGKHVHCQIRGWEGYNPAFVIQEKLESEGEYTVWNPYRPYKEEEEGKRIKLVEIKLKPAQNEKGEEVSYLFPTITKVYEDGTEEVVEQVIGEGVTEHTYGSWNLPVPVEYDRETLLKKNKENELS
ncbi:MAG: hypothetical protein UT32_C0016G0031 [Parcubacteria group bacterium GW2011_GWC2_39_14]|nr:MAG: hypothetical protein UT32_C0016G0031 [Parcubacteria group bacterium GW2011_GWC2_39_14]KKR55105.1 MAG: hypothetical protein UT91_C0004G0004 [Parcubacteria group bacterium GW2011_GWA2_40_23]